MKELFLREIFAPVDQKATTGVSFNSTGVHKVLELQVFLMNFIFTEWIKQKFESMSTLKYLINEYTRLDIMTFFNWKSNLTANFYVIFIVESVENFKSMTNIDFLQSQNK